ncbi:MAG: hypothetical protein ACE5J5_02170 [Candidatus Hydrothermarchaeales archaeon]
MKAQVSLTPTESKRLIAKAVKEHQKVKDALENGIVAIALGSTNAFVAEEILGRTIEKERYVAGIVDEKGSCVVPAKERIKEFVLERGKVIEEGLEDVVNRMGPKDLVIKGGNALDFDGVVGVMLGSETGGTIGRVLGILKARGIPLIIPIGLEKLVPYSISDVSTKTGIYAMDLSTGIPVGIMPVSGEVITELEAFEILVGVETYPMGSGGMGGAEGSHTFLLEGSEEDVEKAFELVKGVKGEAPMVALRGDCTSCIYIQCPKNIKHS